MKKKFIIRLGLLIVFLVSIIIFSTVILPALSETNNNDKQINNLSKQETKYGTGALFTDQSVYDSYKSAPLYFKKSAGNLPRSKDHKKDMPPIDSQGAIGSCTGWATGYYQKSYQEYIEQGKPYSYYENKNNLCSPIFVYIEGLIKYYGNKSQIKGDSGIPTGLACDIIEKKGALSMALSPYPKEAYEWGTYLSSSAQDKVIFDLLDNWSDGRKSDRERFKIKSYDKIVPYNNNINGYVIDEDPFYNDRHIEDIKKSLSSDGPVVFAVATTSSFQTVWNSSDDVYGTDDFKAGPYGGHAINCIGYDDDKEGGSFLLLNSWGKNERPSGTMWMTYDLTKIILKEAYRLNDVKSAIPEPDEPVNNILDVAIEIKSINDSNYKDKNLNYNSSTGFFDLNYNFKIKDRFKLTLKVKEEYSVYFININPSGKMLSLFPEEGYSSFIYANEEYEFPKKENSSYKVNRRGGFGIESFIIILSKEKLDDKKLIRSKLVDISNASNTDEIRRIAFPQLNEKDAKLYSIRCKKVK